MGLKYTKEQRRAIDHRDGNLQIIACAGSGKTEVISRRIAELVREGTLKPSIVAFTFTDRASLELKARIRKHLEEVCADDPSLGDMYVGTIHSFSFQLLKELDPRYRNYEVIDETRQAALIYAGYSSPLGLKALQGQNSQVETVRRFIYTLEVLHREGIPDDDIEDIRVKTAVKAYRKLTLEPPNLFIDFNSIIGVLIAELKRDPDRLTEVRTRFRYVVADEYQDFDRRQEELLKLLTDTGRSASVCVVGDDDQAVYGWRGANVDNMIHFADRYPNVTSISMVDNFRSTHAVVEVANASVRRLAERLPKAMVARHWDFDKDQENPVETMAEHGDIQRLRFTSEYDEAEYIAECVKDRLGTVIGEKDGGERAIAYRDMAILLRSVKSSGRLFVETLRKNGIPAVVQGTGGLFENAEIQLVQASFCLLAGTGYLVRHSFTEYQLNDEVSTRRIIRERVQYLKDTGVLRTTDPAAFLEWIAAKRRTLAEQRLPQRERGRLSRRVYPQKLLHEMLAELGASSGPEPWPEDILYNLGRFSDLVRKFESVHQWVTPWDLETLCFFFNAWAAGRTDDGGMDELTTPNAVQILTVHAAKGLEWPVVFLPRITSPYFPNAYLKNRGLDTFLPASQFNPKSYAGGDDGERRLWYVAVTRARKFLHITSLDMPRKRPTVFHKEIRHDYVRDDGKDPSGPRKRGEPRQSVDAELLPTTYSDLNTYWECPYDYQLRQLMRFSPGVTEAYGYGLQIHNLLMAMHEKAIKGEEITEGWIRATVGEKFNLRYTTGKPLETLREAAIETLIRYNKKFPEQEAYILKAEQPFEFVEGDALISGTIDLLEKIEADDGTRPVPVGVVDFKTGEGENLEEHRRRVESVQKQIALYAVALRKGLNLDPQRALAYFLGPKAPETPGIAEKYIIDISDKVRDGVMAEVAYAVARIKNHVFPRTPKHKTRCKKCEMRGICPGTP